MQTIEIKDLIQPRQKRAQESKAKIFLAAQCLFSKLGLNGVSVDQIAEKAQVNKQRIYAYFGSKKNLYREVLIAAYAHAAQNPKLQTLDETDIPRLTHCIIETFLDYHEQYPDFWRMLCWENLSGGKNLTPADWSKIRSHYMDNLRRLYRQGQEQNIFSSTIPFEAYLYMVFSSTYFYFSNQWTLSHLLELPMNEPDTRRRLAAAIESIIDRGTK